MPLSTDIFTTSPIPFTTLSLCPLLFFECRRRRCSKPLPSSMAVDLMFGHRANGNPAFSSLMEETAVKEAASGLENVGKLIRLLSLPQPSSSSSSSAADVDMACRAVADVAVTKFKKVISLLGRERTGHARFRRGPIANPVAALTPVQAPVQIHEPAAKVYHVTPIQQIPPPPLPQPLPTTTTTTTPLQLQIPLGIHRTAGPLSATTINFAYASGFSNNSGSNVNNNNTASFVSSLTGDNEEKSKQVMSMSSESGFQITNMSVSVGKPYKFMIGIKKQMKGG